LNISSLAQSFRAGEEILLVYLISAQFLFFGTCVYHRRKQEKAAKILGEVDDSPFCQLSDEN
jgi:hypothetical protein